jgi:ATP-dependent DNA helicase RecG
VRPPILYGLFASLRSLSGVGPESLRKLENLDLTTLLSLLWHLPVSVFNRRHISSLKAAMPGEVVTVKIRVSQHIPSLPLKGKRRPYKVFCEDGSGLLELIFFHGNAPYLQKLLPLHEERLISGKIEFFQKHWQISHPDFIGSPSALENWIGPEPVYPLTYGLSQKQLRKWILDALKKCPDLPEWLDPAFLAHKKWPSWKKALHTLHHPQNHFDLSPSSKACERLAYDELLANQLSIALTRHHQGIGKGQIIQGNGRLREKILAALPFFLTEDQSQALEDINHDMASPKRMVRLLQGDVGSGKTIVAFLSLLNAIEAGFQGAYLAPTEILVRQQAQAMMAWAKTVNIQCAVLTGKDSKKERESLYARVRNGEIQLVIGTHALLQEQVVFQNLGLAVIDEQHRFGVSQRLQLSNKGEAVDALVMTATPIPRTLLMATHGDLSCSYLKNKPAGRKEIATKALPVSRLKEVFEALQREIQRDGKIYWVCPLVEDSEVLELTSAEERFKELSTLFPGKIGLVHGRLKNHEKEQVMEAFLKGAIRILVATTVIEVGVHVADATVMVIEHADRFGLSQLHQLRGRIGRGNHNASCLLLYQAPLNPVAQARLEIMRQTNDGFLIAEEDLRLRGGGEVLGVRQSGLPSFRMADLEEHQSLLKLAHQEALKIVEDDFSLTSKRGQCLRVLLYLFEREEAVYYLQAG